MFRILILLEEVGQTENLAEACQIFLQRIKELIEKGQISLRDLIETCMIEAEIDGSRCIMNFPAIRDFSHEIGLLKEDGTLSGRPLPIIPQDIAKGVVFAAHCKAAKSFLDEKGEDFDKVLNEMDEETPEDSLVSFIVPQD